MRSVGLPGAGAVCSGHTEVGKSTRRRSTERALQGRTAGGPGEAVGASVPCMRSNGIETAPVSWLRGGVRRPPRQQETGTLASAVLQLLHLAGAQVWLESTHLRSLQCWGLTPSLLPEADVWLTPTMWPLKVLREFPVAAATKCHKPGALKQMCALPAPEAGGLTLGVLRSLPLSVGVAAALGVPELWVLPCHHGLRLHML